MPDSTLNPGARAEDLCLSCGLCCNGAIFANVKMLPRIDSGALKAISMILPRSRLNSERARILRQPCPAYDGCLCGIYESRPRHCRKFECLLLIKAKHAQVDPGQALKIIRATLLQVKRVQHLLELLGDTDERLALAARFRRMSRLVEAGNSDSKTTETFGRLTVAFHKLSLRLNEQFYPAPADD